MATYEVTHEVESGIVICRILDRLSDSDARTLATALRDTMAEARRHSPSVRMLWDNRPGIEFTTGPLQAVTGLLRASFEPGDRTAVLLSSSLMKVKAKDHMPEGRAMFVSESAALTWLNAWS